MLFVLSELCDAGNLTTLPGHEDATLDTIEAVLSQAATFTSEVLDPLNRSGDTTGARKIGDKVVTSDGWKNAYRQFTEGGWNGVAFNRIWRPRPAPRRRRQHPGNAQRLEHVVRALPAADTRRHRSHRNERLGCAERDVPRENGLRRMDRHHEPDRAASGLRSCRGAHEGRSQGRAFISSPARRSSSLTAITISPTTSSTSCSRARRTRPKASKAFRFSSCRSSS